MDETQGDADDGKPSVERAGEEIADDEESGEGRGDEKDSGGERHWGGEHGGEVGGDVRVADPMLARLSVEWEDKEPEEDDREDSPDT